MIITSQLLKSYQKHARDMTGKRVWLACSGGRDSIVLAFVVLQLYRLGKLPFCPQFIHVNHGLQSANDDWASFVAEWASSFGVACQVIFAKVDGHDEESARTARYQAIMSQMNQDDILMLAHHANDQIETMLMRLFNGAGVTGLAGIKEWTTKSINNKQVYLWRPLLSVNRDQITDYAIEKKLSFVDDPTNLAGNNARSWLRVDLLPSIQQRYPQAIQSTNRTAILLNDANDILQEVYQDDLKKCLMSNLQLEPYNLVLDVERIKQLSLARQRQLIHKWLQGDEPTPPSKLRVDEILGLINRLDNDQQSQLFWQGKNHQYSVRRYRNELHRLRDDWLLILKSQRVWEMKALQEQLANVKANVQANFAKNRVYRERLTIRGIQKTDKFAPKDNQTACSGKKLMQLLGIPSWERAVVQVAEINCKVIAVLTPRQTWYLSNVINYSNQI